MKQIYIIAEESELGIAKMVSMTGINSRNVHICAQDIFKSFLHHLWRCIVFPEPFYQQRREVLPRPPGQDTDIHTFCHLTIFGRLERQNMGVIESGQKCTYVDRQAVNKND